jgi:hypothetical protein
VASATVSDPTGASLATAEVNLSDNVGPSFLRLGVGVMGPPGSGGAPLKGHVTSARLVDGAGNVLAEVPLSTETLYIDGVLALNQDLAIRAEYARVRDALLSGQSKLVMDTDVAGLEHLEVQFADAHDEPGTVGRCSPQ